MEIAEFLGGGECQNSKTLEPIDKKFGMDDYVGDDSLHTKTQNDCLIGGMAAYMWNITLAWFLVILSYFLWPQILLASRDKTIEPIFTRFA